MSDKSARKAFGAQLKQQAETKLKRSLRKQHLASQGGKCFVCRKSLDFERSVLLHKRGPANTEDNTAAVHAGCTTNREDPTTQPSQAPRLCKRLM